MEAITFEVTPNHDGTITIPEALRDKVVGRKLTVTLSYQAENHAKPSEHYTKGYDQKDSLYDKY